MKTKGQKISEMWTRKSMILIRRAERASRESLGYILGVIASDGCIVHSGRSNRIEMKTVNRSFAELFYTKLIEVFGKASCYTKPNTSSFAPSRERHPLVWQVELCDKLVPGFIEGLLRNSKILASSRSLIVGFLKGMYDGDGYVKRKLGHRPDPVAGVGLISGDPLAIKLVWQLLRGLKIECSVEQTTPTCARVMICGRKNIERFANLIGFRVDYRASRLAARKVGEA